MGLGAVFLAVGKKELPLNIEQPVEWWRHQYPQYIPTYRVEAFKCLDCAGEMSACEQRGREGARFGRTDSRRN